MLNRLLLMMEARGQLIESVSKAISRVATSSIARLPVQLWVKPAEAPGLYLPACSMNWQKLPALFERYAANGLLFPHRDRLRALLDNSATLRSNLWAADETIGWIYQYFNSRKSVNHA